MDIIKQLLSDHIEVDAIITDPPYNISKHSNFNAMGRAGLNFGDWDWDFNNFQYFEPFYTILKPGGTCIVFNDWKNLGVRRDGQKQ